MEKECMVYLERGASNKKRRCCSFGHGGLLLLDLLLLHELRHATVVLGNDVAAGVEAGDKLLLVEVLADEHELGLTAAALPPPRESPPRNRPACMSCMNE